ncbi:MAG: amino acid adenylation domain-containing protein [Porticoccaceae bacterium]|jgi:amino acid adenylation domain-containing protein
MARTVTEKNTEPSNVHILEDCLPRMVEQHARDTPNAPAVGWAEEMLSYAALNARANRLAHRLEAMGAGPNILVGLCLPRGAEMVVALLAILKTGAAYLPLDPDYPVERLRRIADRAAPQMLVTEALLEDRLNLGISTLCLQRDKMLVNQESAADSATPVRADQPCYIIFTSGSTGEPKGVIVNHGNVARIFDDITQQLDLRSSDVWSQIHSCAFGFSVFEIWGALIHGACLFIAPVSVRADAIELRKYLRKSGITIMSQTPSAFRETVLASSFTDMWPTLAVRVLVLSGEAVQVDDLQRWSEQKIDYKPRLINTYAVTETGGNVLLREYTAADHDARNIGKPLDYVDTHVLDESFRTVATGEPGELYVGGAGIAAGYLNDAELTASRFMNLPGIGGRVYRTGDIVRVLPDQSFEFLGRSDNQVKWHGFRLELGELESLLRTYPGVSSAVAAIYKDETGNEKLVAYVVPDANSNSQQAEFWPSLGGYQIYDDFLYELMSTDTVRNAAFRTAFERYAHDRVVLDLGTGPHALLAKLAANAGARKVYAVEVLPDMAEKARASVTASNQDGHIVIIAGDASTLELPERAEVCTQGIIGNIGSADGIAAIWNRVRSQLEPDCIPVPERCTTMIAAVELPAALRESPAFAPLAHEYLNKIFTAEGRTFDPRLCIRNLDSSQIISDCHVFEDLDFRGDLPEAWRQSGTFTLNRAGRFDGFLLWTVVTTADEITLDYLEHQHAWLPVFMPLEVGGHALPINATISAEWEWSATRNNIFPDYIISAEFQVAGHTQRSSYTTCHHEKTVGGTELHRRLQTQQNVLPTSIDTNKLRTWLARHMPEQLLPNAWMVLKALPLNSNGKLDRRALPAPEISASSGQGGAPQTVFENDLADIWINVLGISTVCIQDNFFDLGGDSLTAIRLTDQVQQLLDADVALTAIFEAPTIATLICFLEKHFRDAVDTRYQQGGDSLEVVDTQFEEDVNTLADAILIDSEDLSTDQILARQRSMIISWEGWQSSPDSSIFTLNELGTQQGLFWCFQAGSELKKLSAKLGLDQPVHGMRSGHLIMKNTEKNVHTLAEYYASEMTKLQPEGAFIIGGNCQGGVIAQAIASRMHHLGRKVSSLLLMELNLFPTYPGPVELLFGRDSEFNPYKPGANPDAIFKDPNSVGRDSEFNPYRPGADPDAIFHKSYPRGFTVNFIDGTHGTYFGEPNITSLAKVVKKYLS